MTPAVNHAIAPKRQTPSRCALRCGQTTDGRFQPIEFGQGRSPFPAYMLGTVEHMDFENFDDAMAAEYGLMCARLDRAIRSIGSIARVHMNPPLSDEVQQQNDAVVAAALTASEPVTS